MRFHSIILLMKCWEDDQNRFMRNRRVYEHDVPHLLFFFTFSFMYLPPVKSLLVNNKGFTLFELAISMVIFGMIMISVLLSVENMSIARIKTSNRVTLLEELYFFSEQLVTSVKEGGSLDYEEYWNRNSFDTVFSSGHYTYPTWVGNYGSWATVLSWVGPYGNYGDGLYYCRSGSWSSERMGTGGCLLDKNAGHIYANTWGSYSGTYQRYGQYALQYMDYNGNADSDSSKPGDEDMDGSIFGDEDDKDIWDWPIVISGAISELYLLNAQAKTRTYFRWIIRQDPGTSTGCTVSGWVPNEGCIGNIQILKLQWLDIWYSHSWNVTDTGAFDGAVDSWVCHMDWRCSWPYIPSANSNLATGRDEEWVDLFPDTVNVKSLGFTAYPQKDPWKSWVAPDCIGWSCPISFISPFIHPYVRLELTLGFSWWKRRAIRNDDPTISINTSVSLSNM